MIYDNKNNRKIFGIHNLRFAYLSKICRANNIHITQNLKYVETDINRVKWILRIVKCRFYDNY